MADDPGTSLVCLSFGLCRRKNASCVTKVLNKTYSWSGLWCQKRAGWLLCLHGALEVNVPASFRVGPKTPLPYG